MRKTLAISIAIVIGVALAGIGTVALAGRSSSGTFTLSNGPFVSGTVINSATMNGNFGEIGQTLTDSLDRNGKGPMLAPLRTPDGTVTAPAHTFTNETGTGLYRIGASNPGLAVNGVKRQEWTAAGSTVAGTFSATGNSTVGGTLGVTGVATFTAAPVCPAGVSVTGGDITLAKAGLQNIAKSGGGALAVGTFTADDLQMIANNVVVGVFSGQGPSAGTLWMNSHKIGSVADPTLATDAATKGYVDGPSACGGRIRYLTTVTIADANAAFTAAAAYSEADTNYKIIITPSGVSGSPALGSARIRQVTKTTTGFTLNTEVAPGAGSSNTFDVVVMR